MATQQDKEPQVPRPIYRYRGRRRVIIGDFAHCSNGHTYTQHGAYVDPLQLPTGPLSLWLSNPTHEPTSLHQDVSRIVDKELCVRDQCAMFQAKDEASIDQMLNKIDRLRHTGKQIVKDALKNYFDACTSKEHESKTDEFIFKLVSLSIILSETAELDRQYDSQMNDDEKDYDPSQDVEIDAVALKQQQKKEEMEEIELKKEQMERYSSYNGAFGLEAIHIDPMNDKDDAKHGSKTPKAWATRIIPDCI